MIMYMIQVNAIWHFSGCWHRNSYFHIAYSLPLTISHPLHNTVLSLSLSRTLLKCSMFTPHTNYNGSLILWKIWRHDYFNDVKYKIPQTSNSDDKTTRDGRSPLTFSIFKIIYSLFWNCEAELNFFWRTIVEIKD